MRSYKLSAGLLALAVIIAAGCGAPSPPTVQEQPQGGASSQATGQDIQSISNEITKGPHETVKSSGGSAELLIPQGALPPNVKAASIKVTPLQPSEVKGRPADEPLVFAYRLEPSGLRFTRPAVLRIATDVSKGGEVPIVFLSSGDNVEIIHTVIMEPDESSQKARVTIPVTHFSDVWGVHGWFTLTLSGPSKGTYEIGESFQVGAQLSVAWSKRIPFKNPFVLNAPLVEFVLDKNDATLAGKWRASESALAPSLVTEAPPQTMLSRSTDTFSIKQTFTCAKEGGATVEYTAEIRYFTGGYFSNPIIGAYAGIHCDKKPEPMRMLHLSNGYYPRSQFTVAEPDECIGQHYHASGAVFGLADKTSTTVVQATDLSPKSCGFGTVKQIPEETLALTAEQYRALIYR